MEKTIIVFSSVIIERYGNQSIKNFIEGFLTAGYTVYFYTASNEYKSDFIKQYSLKFPKLIIKNIFINQSSKNESLAEYKKYHLIDSLKNDIKKAMRYRKYYSNKDINEWLGLLYYIIKYIIKIKHFIKNSEDILLNSEKIIFIDTFGENIAKTIKILNISLWYKIYNKTAGYYLGTLLAQFKTNLKAFFIMPFSFLGSYRPVTNKLIITNDGTNGEYVFRKKMHYKGPILFILNGLDDRVIENMSRQVDKRFEHKLNFVTSSRLTKWKRIDRAILFIYELKKLNIDVSLTIIGKGEEENKLKLLVKKYKLEKYIEFAGALEYIDAINLIKRHQFYILFNDYSNMGNQVLEALALGLVVITIDDKTTDILLKNEINSVKFKISHNWLSKGALRLQSIIKNGKINEIQKNILTSQKKLISWKERNILERNFLSI